MTGSIFKDLLMNQRGTLGNSTKKCSIKETISENLCFQVIILGFLNVSPYNFFAATNGGVKTLTAPNQALIRFGRIHAAFDHFLDLKSGRQCWRTQTKADV